MSENWKFIPHREVNASLALGLKIVFAALLFFFGAANANASTINRPPNYISLKSGLVGYWTFDGKDLNTGAALDASGQGNHGALVNMSTSTSRVPGKLGQALKFDGVDDKVSFTSTNYGTTHSVSYWINYKDTGDGVVIGGGNGVYATYISDPTTSGLMYYSVEGAQSSLVSVAHGGLKSGQWNYLTVVRDGTSVSFYKNGFQIGTTQTLPFNNALFLSTFGSYSINTYFTTMVLDDVRIYNRALSAAEVQQLYNMGK